ncbi:hypothetical protein BASA81_003240 [Batrachochytrium salamandrivorans]|nr:hypothetical protein BASA81_003240 [Batrachochytrium salamandrivorans]
MGVIWLHAASVGETRSIACLLPGLGGKHAFLVTNSSRRALQGSIPQIDSQCRRIAAPREWLVGQFITQHQPSIGIFVESELWPMLILHSWYRQVPLVLVNGRLSAKSFGRWNANPLTRWACRLLLSRFEFIHAQTKADADRFAQLCPVQRDGEEIEYGNLKSIPIPLSSDEADQIPPEITQLLSSTQPGWAGISLHEGEEEVLIQAQKLQPGWPLVLVPRHPNQGGEPVTEVAPNVYRVNAFGVVSRVCLWASKGTGFVFVGGSLEESVHHGGHNLLEPLQFGCFVGHGKHMENFADSIAEQVPPAAHVEVNTAHEISVQLGLRFPNTMPLHDDRILRRLVRRVHIVLLNAQRT